MAEKNNRPPIQRPTLFAASGLYLLAAVGLWITGLPGGMLIQRIPGLTPEMRTLLVSILYYLPFLALPAYLCARRRGDAMRILRINPIAPGAMIRAAIVALLTLLIAQNIQMLWMIPFQKMGFDVFASPYVRPADTAELTRSVVSMAILAPIGEELLFRGAMLSAWERRGPKAAILATSALFALLHGSILGLPGEILGGLMLGLLVVWTDSIYAGLTFHTVYNAGALMLNYISSGVPEQAAEEALMRADLLGYLGGFSAVIVLLADILLMVVIILLVTRRLRMVYAFRSMVAYLNEHPELTQRGARFERGQLLARQAPEDPAPMTLGARLMLGLALLGVLGLYAMDIFSMLGG